MRRRLLTALASTCLSLVMVEVVVLRGALGYHGLSDLTFYEPDPQLGWTMVPNARRWHAGLDFGMWVESDALGLRAPLGGRPATPPTEGERLLVLGDSFAFGWGVPEDLTFAAELERHLRSRGHPYSVRTAGVPGYATDQEYLQWQRLSAALRPTQVVLLLHQSDPPGNIQSWSDMGRFAYAKPRFRLESGRLRVTPPPTPARRPLLPASRFEPIKDRFRPLATYALLQSALRNGVRLPFADGPRESPLDPAAFDVTAALLAAIRDDVEAHGATLVIAVIPAEQEMVGRLTQACNTLGIRFLDLTPAFAGQARAWLRYDGHWSATGHAIAARAVAPLLR